MKTKIPLNFYSLVVVIIVFIFYLIKTGDELFEIIIYPFFFGSFWYILFCRYDCIIEVNQKEIVIRYLFPWNKKLIVLRNKIIEIDYQKGFYDFISDKSIVTYGNLNYCFDRLILKIKSEDELFKININTRFGEFDKIIRALQTHS